MITEIKERKVSIIRSSPACCYIAIVRDGKIYSIDPLGSLCQTEEHLRIYIEFLSEIIEAIHQTS